MLATHAEFTAEDVGLIDGVTLDVLAIGKPTVRLRPSGVDAPGRGQPFGNIFKRSLSPSAGQFVRVVGIS